MSWLRPPGRAIRKGVAAGLKSGALPPTLFLLVLVSATIVVLLGLDGRDALEIARQHQALLLKAVASTPALAALAYMAAYGATVALSLPGAMLLSMLGGYLFGWWEATIYVLIAATVAASAMFLLARSAIFEKLRSTRPALLRFAQAFKANGFSYVFILHLVPVFPYAMVIGLPAACGVRFRTFVIGGFLGVLPGTIFLTRLGEGLGHVLLSGRPLHISSFLTAEIVGALAGLAALALLPVALRACLAQKRG